MSMKLTWYGTASLSIDDTLLIDPFVPVEHSSIHIHENRYKEFNHILLTHGHIDHVSSLPKIVGNRNVSIYGTSAVRKSLQALKYIPSNFKEIYPGDDLCLEGYRIKVYKSKHTKFDYPLIKNTLINKRILEYRKELKELLSIHRKCKERNETVGYLIEKKNTSIFILGSLNINEHVKYPKHMDVLVLPYQGTSYLDEMSSKIINIFEPKTIFLDHFDDTFPPISNTINTTSIQNKYKDQIIKPDYEIEYDI